MCYFKTHLCKGMAIVCVSVILLSDICIGMYFSHLEGNIFCTIMSVSWRSGRGMKGKLGKIILDRRRWENDRLCGLVLRVPGYISRGPGFDFQRYQIFWKVVDLKRGPFSLVSTIEELLGRNNSGCGLENREYGRGDPLRWPRGTPLFAKVGTNFTDKLRSPGRYSSLAD
jgi:hypothetical protein